MSGEVGIVSMGVGVLTMTTAKRWCSSIESQLGMRTDTALMNEMLIRLFEYQKENAWVQNCRYHVWL